MSSRIGTTEHIYSSSPQQQFARLRRNLPRLWRKIKARGKQISCNLWYKKEIKFSLYSLYYAKACSEFAEPISASLRPRNTASKNKTSQRWQHCVSHLSLNKRTRSSTISGTINYFGFGLPPKNGNIGAPAEANAFISNCPWPGICWRAAINWTGSIKLGAIPGNMAAGGRPPRAAARAALLEDICWEDEDLGGEEEREGSNLVCKSFGKNFCNKIDFFKKKQRCKSFELK